MVDLAIIIVSRNTKAHLERCLDSLHRPSPHLSHEIIVVDNASTDASVEMVRSRWSDTRVVALDTNIGFGAANNVGFRASSSELVLLLNSDTIVPDKAVDRLVAALRSHPDAAIVGPRLVDRDGRPELSFGKMIGPFAELRQKTLARFDSIVAKMTSQSRTADWVSAACLLVRRSAAEGAGLFDERYFMYGEDVDFCAAVRSRGGRIYFAPDIEVVHLRGRSGLSNHAATRAAYRRSQLAFYRKHHPGWAPVLKAYLAVRGKLPAETVDK
jgi:GT2 family glycosyltransferase